MGREIEDKKRQDEVRRETMSEKLKGNGKLKEKGSPQDWPYKSSLTAGGQCLYEAFGRMGENGIPDQKNELHLLLHRWTGPKNSLLVSKVG